MGKKNKKKSGKGKPTKDQPVKNQPAPGGEPVVTGVAQFILNCRPSVKIDEDWTFEDAVDAGVVNVGAAIPPAKDLREPWWEVNFQGDRGACVGYATAYGVLRWHYTQAGLIQPDQLPSARFIWMANKETDDITSYPTTFLESTGTQTKMALGVARKFGCVLEDDLPMDGPLSMLNQAAFYAKASKLRISSFHNLGLDLNRWRHWLAWQGPILTRLGVDRTWDQATSNGGFLEAYQSATLRGGHAVCLVGYTEDHFIVRNSWGPEWGDGGFAYASNAYTAAAFTEAYGAVL